MPRKKFNYETELASWVGIARRSKKVQNILWRIFYTTPELREFPEHLAIGLNRIEAQSLLAQTLATHMEERGAVSLEEFLHTLNREQDSNETECFTKLRYPAILWLTDHKNDRQPLLSTCDLRWDEGRKEYVPITPKRPA